MFFLFYFLHLNLFDCSIVWLLVVHENNDRNIFLCRLYIFKFNVLEFSSPVQNAVKWVWISPNFFVNFCFTMLCEKIPDLRRRDWRLAVQHEFSWGMDMLQEPRSNVLHFCATLMSNNIKGFLDWLHKMVYNRNPAVLKIYYPRVWIQSHPGFFFC